MVTKKPACMRRRKQARNVNQGPKGWLALFVMLASAVGALQQPAALAQQVASAAFRTVWAVPYVDGEGRHGQWVKREANGVVEEGAFVDDKQHGPWVRREADGAETCKEYLDGEIKGDC